MPRTNAARTLLLALPAALLLACSSEPPDTHPDKPVTQRREAFKAMLPFHGFTTEAQQVQAMKGAYIQQQAKVLQDIDWAHLATRIGS